MDSNGGEFVRKWYWPDYKYYLGMFAVILKKTTTTLRHPCQDSY
jgi:hypothetical protein